MTAKGDIGDVVGIADTISSPVGTITTRPLIPVAWQAATPTLVTGSHATPPEQGDIVTDAPIPTNPDFFGGSFTLASVTPTLGVGSVAAPAHKGDVGDVYGAPDLGMDAQVAGLAAFQQVAPTIGPVSGSYLPPIAHGDVGDTGGPTTLKGDTNDSNAGYGTLTSWSTGTITLTLGSIPQTRNHGDIGEMYGLGEGPIGQKVWQIASVTLTTSATVTPPGNGDITDPYAWQDVVLYRTSQTYPVESIDNYTPGFTVQSGFFMPDLITESENVTLGLTLHGGTFYTGLYIYSNYPTEHYSIGFTMTGGSLTVTTGYIVYNNWPPENYTLGLTMTGGSLTVTTGYIVYNNWPPENYTLGLTLTGGSLA